MKLVKCVNAKSNLSIEHINGFGNKTTTTVTAKGIDIDLKDGTDLANKVQTYINAEILFIDGDSVVAVKPKDNSVNPFEGAAKKVEAKEEPKKESKPATKEAPAKQSSDSEVKVESTLTEKKEDGKARPAAKKK